MTAIIRSNLLIPPDPTPEDLAEFIREYVQRMNANLSAIQSRFERLEVESPRLKGTGVTLPAPQQFAVEGRQGLFHLTWQKALGTVDGYVVFMSPNANMSSPVHRIQINDKNAVQYQISVGNIAATRYFQLFLFYGKVVSPPSAVVSATSVEYGSPESAPAAPPVAPGAPQDQPPGEDFQTE